MYPVLVASLHMVGLPRRFIAHNTVRMYPWTRRLNLYHCMILFSFLYDLSRFFFSLTLLLSSVSLKNANYFLNNLSNIIRSEEPCFKNCCTQFRQRHLNVALGWSFLTTPSVFLHFSQVSIFNFLTSQSS